MSFWKPGQAGPKFDLEADRYGSEHTTTFHFNPNVARDIRRQRLLLPIASYRDAIIEHIETYSTLIILGLSGCGKSTQIPQYLYESGFSSQAGSSGASSAATRFCNKNRQIIACVQPTKNAALMLAARIAEEQGSCVGKGGIVGCNAQYFSHTDDSTCKIKVLTCENILRELHRDPLLLRYSVVVIDQVDDRDAFMDILFGAVKSIK